MAERNGEAESEHLRDVARRLLRAADGNSILYANAATGREVRQSVCEPRDLRIAAHHLRVAAERLARAESDPHVHQVANPPPLSERDLILIAELQGVTVEEARTVVGPTVPHDRCPTCDSPDPATTYAPCKSLVLIHGQTPDSWHLRVVTQDSGTTAGLWTQLAPDELRQIAVSVARDGNISSADAERRISLLTRIADAVVAASEQEKST